MYHKTRRLALWCVLSIAASTIITGCAYGTTFALRPTIPPTPTASIANNQPVVNPIITTGASLFISNATITVTIGTTVTFNDPDKTGGYHVLASGTNGQYVPDNDAPSDLNTATGVTFLTGDTRKYAFMKPGPHSVTCLLHPAMNVTIIVVATA